MERTIIDLSISIAPGLSSDPEIMIPMIDDIDHAQGAKQMEMFFPGLKKEQLPECQALKPQNIEQGISNTEVWNRGAQSFRW